MSRKIPETLKIEELAEIVKATNNKNHRLAYMLGFFQCMRISEVVNLKPEHIDKGRKILMIKAGKGDKDRNIPIAPEVNKFLKHVPINIGIRALQKAFKLQAKKVLGKDMHFHQLRHSGATYYLNKKKWNIRILQNFLGHASIQTTQIYTHVNPEDLAQAMFGGLE